MQGTIHLTIKEDGKDPVVHESLIYGEKETHSFTTLGRLKQMVEPKL